MKSADSILIKNVKVSAYKIPTDFPEADGTIEWDSTTMILVEITAADKTGIGYTYAHEAAAVVVEKTLKDIVVGKNAMNIDGITSAMTSAIRNNGNCGIAMMAVSAVNNALWDLKAKIFDVPLSVLLGKVHDEILIYGSGGFTSYPEKRLQQQLSAWDESGIRHVKMKIGADACKAKDRVKAARKAISGDTQLFVDANGAYTVKQALEMANAFASQGVTWFEEPVRSDNLEELHFLKDHIPAPIKISAGEYGYSLSYFESMISAGAVDVLQADATRCGGITGFLKAGVLAEANQLPFSSHCAPALHLQAAMALPSFFIAEYFYDHVRIEEMFFDGITLPKNGHLQPCLSHPGMGFEFKYKDAEPYKI